jgi:hypothetical protein
MTTTLKQAVKLISEGIDFKGNSLYAETIDNLYIVYSYGKHFPIAVYNFDTKIWYINTDKYSVTTSKHQSIVKQAIAINEEKRLCNLEEINQIIHTKRRL